MRKLKLSELNRPSVETYKDIEKIPVVVVLDDIRSAHNVGSVFRTADAFLIKKIYLCGISATPPHKEINKSALGATESVEWEHKESCLETILQLKKENYQIISIEQAEESIKLEDYKINLNQNYALVFGNEVNGVNQEIINHSDDCLEIKQHGTKHSLNISVCAGIVMNLFCNQIKNPA